MSTKCHTSGHLPEASAARSRAHNQSSSSSDKRAMALGAILSLPNPVARGKERVARRVSWRARACGGGHSSLAKISGYASCSFQSVAQLLASASTAPWS